MKIFSCWQCGADLGFRPGLCERCAAEAARIDRERHLAALCRVRIPARYADARWSSSALAERVRVPPDRLRELCRALVEAHSSVLLGGSGAGKSTLAAAWLRGRIEGGDERARFVSARELLSHAYAPAEPVIEAAIRSTALVLDDLGAELDGAFPGGYDHARRVGPVRRVVALRHDAGLSTVVTTGLDREAIRALYDDGICRRLFECGAVLRVGAAPKAPN